MVRPGDAQPQNESALEIQAPLELPRLLSLTVRDDSPFPLHLLAAPALETLNVRAAGLPRFPKLRTLLLQLTQTAALPRCPRVQTLELYGAPFSNASVADIAPNAKELKLDS